MKPEIKALWIDALRSGDYKQCRNQLRQGDTFCCLGVLTELAVQAGAVKAGEVDEDEMYVYPYTVKELGDEAYEQVEFFDLHRGVMEWSGMTSPTGNLPSPIPFGEVGNYSRSLVQLNDHAGYNFNQIADVIEEQF